MVKVLSLDPAMRNLGICIGEVDPVTLEVTPELIALVQTSDASGKTVRKNSDDLRRASELWSEIDALQKQVDLVIAEVPTGTQSARGAMPNGICIGLLAAIHKPLIQVTPTEAKMVAVGRKNASKEEMIEWASTRFPNLGWKTVKRKGVVHMTADNEHMCDAVAIMFAGVKTTEFKSAMAMFASLRATT
jgi:hypothetical protein